MLVIKVELDEDGNPKSIELGEQPGPEYDERSIDSMMAYAKARIGELKAKEDFDEWLDAQSSGALADGGSMTLAVWVSMLEAKIEDDELIEGLDWMVTAYKDAYLRKNPEWPQADEMTSTLELLRAGDAEEVNARIKQAKMESMLENMDIPGKEM